MEVLAFQRQQFPSFLVHQATPPSEFDSGGLACKMWFSMNSHLPIPATDFRLVSKLREDICTGFRKQARKGRLQLQHVRCVRWLPPPYGSVKLNTDGGLKYHNGHASVGGLIRDCRGRWIKGFVRNLGRMDDCLMVELIAVRDRLYLLARMNLYNAIIEMDCETAASLLKCGLDKEYPEKDDPPQILVLNECIQVVRFMKVAECRNGTDVRILLPISAITQILDTSPDEVDHFLWADRVGVNYLGA